MENDKTKLNRLPYLNLSKVNELITFDRVILSLFKNKDNEYFLLYFIDELDTYDEYVFWKVKLVDLYSFLHKRVSLRDLVLVPKEFVYIIQSDLYSISDLNSSESYSTIYQIFLNELDEQWLPDNDSYWEYDISFDLVSILDHFAENNYLEVLRENSVYFLIEPKDKRYLSTVSTIDITNFLSEFTKSYIEFILFDFSTKFKDNFRESEFYQNSLMQLRSSMLPRVADTKFGSFEVGLSVDFQYPLIQEDKAIFNWQKSAIDVFKEEVLDINYDSFEEVDKLLEKYPLPVRKAIFQPIYKIANNDRYTVKSTNRLKTYFDNLPVISKDTRKTIFQSDDEDLEAELKPIEYELQSAVFSVPIGGNIGDLDKKTLRKRLLAVSRSDTTEIKLENSFFYKDKYFQLIAPLSLRLAVKGLINILICDVFGIDVDSQDNIELYRKLEKAIYEFYMSRVINNPRSTDAQVFNIYFKVTGYTNT